jgi:hypothetical protein
VMASNPNMATSSLGGLTPELSRAERGRREPVLLALRQVSTKPRDGVGLNDWLGAKEAGEG